MSEKRRIISYAFASVISLTGVVVLFLTVNPTSKPVVYVFFPVVLVWICAFSMLRLSFLLVFKRATKLQGIIAFMTVSIGVLLLLLSGIGQLTVADFLLICSLAFVSGFYFYRSWT